LVDRYRLFDPLFVKVGGFGAPEALAIFTGGAIAAFHQSDRLSDSRIAGARRSIFGVTHFGPLKSLSSHDVSPFPIHARGRRACGSWHGLFFDYAGRR
jgi:hypothetical protein